MLMRFSVYNFLSFPYKINIEGNVIPTEFILYAGRTESFQERLSQFGGRKVLKFASVYGANAAGKSNLVNAVESGKEIVLGNLEDFSEDCYCRNEASNKDKPTMFEYEFAVEGRCFAYGFTVNLYEKRIITEWLTELNGEQEVTVFERDAEQELYYFDESYFSTQDNIQQFHFYLKDANHITSSLLLHELERRHMEEKDFQLYHMIYNWFRKELVVIYPETRLGKSYARFGSDNEKLVKILEYLDTGITGYKMQKINENAFRENFLDQAAADKFLKNEDRDKSVAWRILMHGRTLFEIEFEKGKLKSIFKLLFIHGSNDILFEYGEESDGTQRLIELLEIILNDDGEKTFIIDELDRSLHPQMTKKFVETFFRFSENMKTQLIMTTHESNLMDLNMLRRDEIWFAEREADHATTLYPLEKFIKRYDRAVSKAYLDGRYGAVPVFKDFEYVFGREDG